LFLLILSYKHSQEWDKLCELEKYAVFSTCFNHADKLNVSVAFKVSVTGNIYIYVESFEAKFVCKSFGKSHIYKAIKGNQCKDQIAFIFFISKLQTLQTYGK